MSLYSTTKFDFHEEPYLQLQSNYYIIIVTQAKYRKALVIGQAAMIYVSKQEGIVNPVPEPAGSIRQILIKTSKSINELKETDIDC